MLRERSLIHHNNSCPQNVSGFSGFHNSRTAQLINNASDAWALFKQHHQFVAFPCDPCSPSFCLLWQPYLPEFLCQSFDVRRKIETKNGLLCPDTNKSNENREKRKADCTLDFSDPFAKYTIESPSWLPQGWITEIQIRRTGSTAGMRDKYYKDLVSGRRFRSRAEVCRYLETGKGRLRIWRRKKKTPSYAQRSQGSMTYLPSNNVSDNACMAAQEQTDVSRKSFPADSKRPVQDKLPVRKGVSLESSKVCGDWHADCKVLVSNQGQQDNGVYSGSEILGPSVIAKCSQDSQLLQMHDHVKPHAEGCSSVGELTAADRRSILGRKLQEAQQCIVNVGTQMQATITKLGQDLEQAQKVVQQSADMNACCSEFMQDVKGTADGQGAFHMPILKPGFVNRQQLWALQKMKEGHAKQVLVVLGRQLCRKALHESGH